MSEIIITPTDIRTDFPEFTDNTKYPDGFIQRNITTAGAYVSTTKGQYLKDDVRKLAIEYMTCHLMTLTQISATGVSTGQQTSGIVTSSSVGGVSVSMAAPIAGTAFEQWIQGTGYGQLYWALLKANSPVGIYVPGNRRMFGIR